MVMDIEYQSSTEEVDNSKARKKGIMSRFRRKGDNKRRDATPSHSSSSSSEPSGDGKYYTREGVPIVTSTTGHDFRPSEVRKTPRKKKESGAGHRSTKEVYKPPPAREAAFAGPPRYDWIDIETAAAIKVQSVYRRNKAVAQLEREGKSTAQMRNRRRKRQAKQRLAIGEDAPGFLQCCGVGLVFGDATEEDQEVVKEYERAQYYEKRKEKEEKEGELRKFKWRKKSSNHLVEGVEVVESFEEGKQCQI